MSSENESHFSKALGQFLEAFPDSNQIEMLSSKAKAILADYADAQYPEGERTNIEAIQRAEEKILRAVLKPLYLSLGTVLLAPVLIALVAACSTSALQEHVSIFKVFKSLFVGK